MAVDIESLMLLIKSAGYPDVKKISGNKVAVLTDKNRIDVLNDLSKKIKGSRYDKTPASDSSVGRLKIGSLSVLAKPSSKQGAASAGVGNEKFLVDTINKFLKTLGSANVVFIAGTKKYKVPACVSIKSVGADTAGRKKADVVLKNNKNIEYPVSIKKDDAETWESADSYFREEAEKIIKKAVENNQTKLVKQGSYYTIEPNIAVAATRSEKINVVFGSDLSKNGAVITKTFSSNDIEVVGDEIRVYVSSIILTLEDVKGDKDVYFLIRNDKTRKTIKKYPGIRVLAAYKKRINKNVQIVKR